MQKIKHKDVSTAVPQEKCIKYKMAAENRKYRYCIKRLCFGKHQK